MTKAEEGAMFVRYYGPLLDALRDLGGSAKAEEAVNRVAPNLRISGGTPVRRESSSSFAFVALLVMLAVPLRTWGGQAEVSRDLVVRPAVDGVFEAFERHPLVGLGEAHGVAQILDFYQIVVRDPRFAKNVGNVVVEFGGAAHQNVIDRYVNGETVPYADLRRVWTDTVGWTPTVPNGGYASFFAQVRQTNLALAAEERIKVWLGEPPISWPEIRTSEAYERVARTRDAHAAEVIKLNILAKGRKALVIYGGGHLERTDPWEEAARAEVAAADPGGPMSQINSTLRDLVERDFPGSFFVSQTYRGFDDAECTKRFEQAIKSWPMPALVISVRGTSLEVEMRRCLAPVASRLRFPPTVPADVQERVRKIIADNADRDRPLLADAVLFHALAEDLTVGTQFVELALDEEWRAELSRRNEVMTGRPLAADWGRSIPASPVPYGGRDR